MTQVHVRYDRDGGTGEGNHPPKDKLERGNAYPSRMIEYIVQGEFTSILEIYLPVQANYSFICANCFTAPYLLAP